MPHQTASKPAVMVNLEKPKAKKAKSSFIFYVQEQMNKIKDDIKAGIIPGPPPTQSELMKRIGELWKNLTDA